MKNETGKTKAQQNKELNEYELEMDKKMEDLRAKKNQEMKEVFEEDRQNIVGRNEENKISKKIMGRADDINEDEDYKSYKKRRDRENVKEVTLGTGKLVEGIANYSSKKSDQEKKEVTENKNEVTMGGVDTEAEKKKFLEMVLDYKESEKHYEERKKYYEEGEKYYDDEIARLKKILKKLEDEEKLLETKGEIVNILEKTDGQTTDSGKENEQGVNIIEEDIAAEGEVLFEVKKIKEDIDARLVEEPEQVKVKEIIEENITPEEKIILQQEFPNQNIENLIEDEAVKQINDKNIKPFVERMRDTLLKRTGRKVTVALAVILVSASSFKLPKATKIYKAFNPTEALSYSNLKVDNLKNWENIKLYEDEINMKDNISIINKAHENSDDKYLIIDKQNGKAHRYQGDNLIKSYNVGLGQDSIGDDQTKLKTIYRKGSKEPDINANGERVFHRRQEVSLDEATYVENNERYMRPGYEAFTKWGEGNMQTGAGTYMISNKGSFLKNKGIFLKNERGVQVATTIHFNSHVYPEMPSPYISNGCVGGDQPTIDELYKVMSLGENVYILPANPHNKYQIIDGDLRFLSNQKEVNKTIRPYAPRPIVIRAENPNEVGKILLISIAENKEKLMKLYPTISNDVYNEFAKIAYGIFGKESTFGTYGKGRGQAGRVADIGKTIAGLGHPSVGPCQVNIVNVDKKVRDAYNIKNVEDLYDIKTNAAAAMSILMDNYLYVQSNGKGDHYKELTILNYNAPGTVRKIIKDKMKYEDMGPICKSYINKVLEFSKPATVYTGDVSENYYASNWDYSEPNN